MLLRRASKKSIQEEHQGGEFKKSIKGEHQSTYFKQALQFKKCNNVDLQEGVLDVLRQDCPLGHSKKVFDVRGSSNI